MRVFFCALRVDDEGDDRHHVDSRRGPRDGRLAPELRGVARGVQAFRVPERGGVAPGERGQELDLGAGRRVQGSGFRVRRLLLMVYGLGFMVQGSEFRVQGQGAAFGV